jgi:hypothetical protein
MFILNSYLTSISTTTMRESEIKKTHCGDEEREVRRRTNKRRLRNHETRGDIRLDNAMKCVRNRMGNGCGMEEK